MPQEHDIPPIVEAEQIPVNHPVEPIGAVALFSLLAQESGEKAADPTLSKEEADKHTGDAAVFTRIAEKVTHEESLRELPS